MPENTVYVGRGSKWGNPYRLGIDGDAKECVLKYRNRIDFYYVWEGVEIIAYLNLPATLDLSVYPSKILTPDAPIINQLKGKNLSCWCKLDQPCHADILLEIANGS